MPKTKGGLVPANIKNLSTGEIAHFMFNPNEYSISKSNTWNREDDAGKNVPSITFKQGSPISLKLQLYFDTYMDESRIDIREYTDVLWKMMVVDPNKEDPDTKKSEPPKVAFQWGKFYFEAVIKSLSQKFTLFLEDGTPVRSTVDISLEQIEDPTDFKPQAAIAQPANPRKSIVATLSTRLDQIAAEHLKDATQYRKIAEANNMDDPRKPKPGQTLTTGS